ncbi:ATPase domain-containing protein [Candidatus Xianfuyuplasma coldseepsis]|uniref:Protein RecA n=1 Tax=Candidatus Xianfuyuplasma coldseepsis TaxID=2782163 RepID=A0A7L7KQW9_9MOLU|nr:ATPase domain-containing protein [Xianfuyuplasma coldseepsis]QMS84829.1 AAA family ATPase [Xianfuyuplasma coldseepsis]
MKKTTSFNKDLFKKSLVNSLSNYKEGSKQQVERTPKYSTGIIPLDDLLEGGFPMGSIVGFGSEAGVGKTTILLQACANIVKKYNKTVYYIDVENGAKLDLIYKMEYTDMLYHPESNPEGRFYLLSFKTIQDIVSFINQAAKGQDTAVIVIDSVTQVVDEESKEKDDLDVSNKQKGKIATMWSKASRALNTIIGDSDISLIMVHQARQKLNDFNPKTTSAGGNALKHITSVELWAKKGKYINEKYVTVDKASNSIGFNVKLQSLKSRCGDSDSSRNLVLFKGKGAVNVFAVKEWLEEYQYYDKKKEEYIPYFTKNDPWKTYNIPQLSIYIKERSYTKILEQLNYHRDELIPYVIQQLESNW